LEIPACNLTPGDAEAIARSPGAARLTKLLLPCSDMSEEAHRALAASPYFRPDMLIDTRGYATNTGFRGIYSDYQHWVQCRRIHPGRPAGVQRR